jgi:hypothetical protein
MCLLPTLRSPHAPFAELVRLSDKNVADGLREEHTRRVRLSDKKWMALSAWRERRFSLAGTPRGKGEHHALALFRERQGSGWRDVRVNHSLFLHGLGWLSSRRSQKNTDC